MPKKTRREFLKMLGMLTSTSLVGSSLYRCHPNKPENEMPFQNIVFIISDDHAANVLGCYDNPRIRTPNLDRMAANGVRFTHAYANAPVCSASRQSILTGKYPHATGVTLLRTSFPDEQYTIAEHLQANGFKTAVIGKTHFNNNLSHGFEVRKDSKEYREYLKQNPPREPDPSIKTRPPWKPFRDHARIWLNSEVLPGNRYDADDLGTYLANQAIDFIDQNKTNRFCLWVGFHEPHSPFNFPIEYAGKYHPQDIPVPPGSPEDDRWIPEIFRDLTDAEKQGIIAAYYTSVEYMDKNVGLILNHLEKTGLANNTLIIYVGDQGYLLGEHKRFEKHTMWEEAIRSPLIIQAAGQYGTGRKIGALVEFIDLAPTIVEALGIAPMPDVQGKSLLPLLKDNHETHKNQVFCEFLCDNKAMLRTREWKYIFTSGKRDLGQGYATGFPPPGITHRLYNLIEDPQETKNLAEIPKLKPIVVKLKQQMLKLFQTTHPKSNELPAGLSIDEALVWFCEPPDANADLEAK